MGWTWRKRSTLGTWVDIGANGSLGAEVGYKWKRKQRAWEHKECMEGNVSDCKGKNGYV